MLVLVLRQQRHHVGRGIDILHVELDAGFLEVALLDRHERRADRDRARAVPTLMVVSCAMARRAQSRRARALRATVLVERLHRFLRLRGALSA